MAYAGAEFVSHHPLDHWREDSVAAEVAGGSALAEKLAFFSSNVEFFHINRIPFFEIDSRNQTEGVVEW